MTRAVDEIRGRQRKPPKEDHPYVLRRIADRWCALSLRPVAMRLVRHGPHSLTGGALRASGCRRRVRARLKVLAMQKGGISNRAIGAVYRRGPVGAPLPVGGGAIAGHLVGKGPKARF